MRLAELALEAGLPDGLFQVLPGKGSVVGERFVTNETVRKVVFTGSTEVGKQIMAGCAEQVKRVTLELGGKSANIVFADADLEKAAATAPYAVFENAGQDCCARSRILVERSVYDRFMELLEPAVAGVAGRRPGRRGHRDGPARRARAPRLACGRSCPTTRDVAFRGTAPDGPGLLVRADRAHAGARLTACVHRGDLRPGRLGAPVRRRGRCDPVRQRRASTACRGSIWTRDVGRGIRVARAVETGNLCVNSHSSVRYATPFGGFKQSGLGRELGPDAPLAFTETKNVFLAVD